MATLHLVGELKEVKPVEFEDKKTGKITYSTELTVMFQGIDEQGYGKWTVETISVDEEYFEEMKDKKGSTVAMPYVMKVDQWGIKTYPDRSMPVLVLEKNPFDYSKFEKAKTVRSVTK